MLNVRLRSAVMVAGLGLGWTLIAPPAAAAQCTFDVGPVDGRRRPRSRRLRLGDRRVDPPAAPLRSGPLNAGSTWGAVSSVNWISASRDLPLLAHPSTLDYTVAANPTTDERTGTLTVAGQTVTITQLACPSPPRVSPTSLEFSSAGGSKDVAVQEAAHCRYAVSDNQPWIRVRPATVAGNGTVTITVDPNTGSSALSGTVTIGGTTVSVSVPPPPPPPPECTFQVGYTSREVADDPGQYEVTVTASAPTCRWSMTSHETWITIATPTRTGSTNGVYRTESNTTPGSPQRTGNMTVAGQTVTITQRRGPENGVGENNIGVPPLERPSVDEEPEPFPRPLDLEALSEHRDRLVGTYAARTGESNLCRAWHMLDISARNVFIWNTHRLHRSDLLPEVTGLYALFGTDNAKSCGGDEYNRTYMSMTESLQDKFFNARTGEGPLSKWRDTNDPKGPHDPYMFSLETHRDGPRGQIHFFHRNWVPVIRTYNDDCNSVRRIVTRETAERCQDGCDGRRTVPVYPWPDPDWLYYCNGNRFTDQIVRDPLTDSFRRGPDDEVTLGGGSEGALVFEMDQDYNQYSSVVSFHDSAPTCINTKWSPTYGTLGSPVDRRDDYTDNYGDPQWDWEPSACAAAHEPMAAFTFFDDSLPSTPIRAVTTRELRVRVNSLRDGLGLTPFVWTDPTISSGETAIRAVHMTELRSAITEAYVAAGRESPTYTDDPIIAWTTPIKPVHITELRAAVIALEQ